MFERHWFEVPSELVIKTDRPRMFGFPLALREDVQAWCKKNRIRARVSPAVVIIAGMYVAPFLVSIRSKKKAALFKMWWC